MVNAARKSVAARSPNLESTEKNAARSVEETMRKSLVLMLMAVGGGASYATGVTEVGVDSQTSDPSTWRWHVNAILDDQRKSSLETAGWHGPGVFDQRFERYSPQGRPEAQHRSP